MASASLPMFSLNQQAMSGPCCMPSRCMKDDRTQVQDKTLAQSMMEALDVAVDAGPIAAAR